MKILFATILTFCNLLLISQDVQLINSAYSGCDKSTNTYSYRTKIVEHYFTGDTLYLEISKALNCCGDFIPSINFNNDTLDLGIKHIGDECDCICCYHFVFGILGLKDKKFEITYNSQEIETEFDFE